MSLTIFDAIPTAAPLLVLGMGSLASNAVNAASQKETPVTVIDVGFGKPSPVQTAEELVRKSDPAMKPEMFNKPNSPQMVIGTSGPGMGGPS